MTMKKYGWLLFGVAFLTGCIKPNVESKKTNLILVNPSCTADCTAAKVTVNMNSGTAIEADIDQDVSPKTDLKLK
jgi:hypothetical protein